MKMQTLGVLLCGASLLATPALAQPATGTQQLQYVVNYSDLDVTREEGARVLLGRLHGAARIVCSPAADSRELDRTALYTSCMREAMDRAVAAVHLPLVSELYGKSAVSIAEN